MDFNVFIPVIDALSKAMEMMPNPWIAGLGVVLAGLVYVWRKSAQSKNASAQATQQLAEVIAIKSAPAQEQALAEAKAKAIVDAALKGDKAE